MTSTYVIQVGKQFLGAGEDGDIGFAPDIKEAKHFRLYEDAKNAAAKHGDSEYQIITVDAAS